jgi:hypothetical protein
VTPLEKRAIFGLGHLSRGATHHTQEKPTMKKTIPLCLALLAVLSACEQQAPPSPAAPATPQSTLNSTEQQLCGNWILRKSEVYYYDTVVNVQTQTYSDSLHCHVRLDSTYIGNNQPSYEKVAISGLLQCVEVSTMWNKNSGLLYLGGSTYNIQLLTPDSLVIQDSTANINMYTEHRYYLSR